MRRTENRRTGGVRDFRKIFPVLLFSCRRGLRTRRPRLRLRGRDGHRGRPRKFLTCVPGRSAPSARRDEGDVLRRSSDTCRQPVLTAERNRHDSVA